jgi:hypothetical protein
MRRALGMLMRIIWFVGIRGDYRREFWWFAWRRIRRGEIEALLHVTVLAHHLILFARLATEGQRSASNYSVTRRDVLVPAE